MSLDKDSRTLIDLVTFVQNEEARKARRAVFKKYEDDKVLHEEMHNEVEELCWRFNVCGMLTKDSPQLRKKFISSWGYSISESWKVVEEVVRTMRENRNNAALWKDFEDLAKESKGGK